jgi:hypothetical protein
MATTAVQEQRIADLYVAVAKLDAYIINLSGVPVAKRTADQSADLVKYTDRRAAYQREILALIALRGPAGPADPALDAAQAAAAAAAAAVAAALALVQQAADASGVSLSGPVGASIETILASVTKVLGATLGAVSKSVVALVGGADEAVAGVLDDLLGGVHGTVLAAERAVQAAVAELGEAVAGIGQRVAAAAADPVATLTGGIADLINQAAAGLAEVAVAARDRIAAVIDGIDLPGIGDWLAELTEALDAIKPPDDLLSILGRLVGETTDDLAAFLADPAGKLFGLFFEGVARDLTPRLDPVLRRLEANPHTPPELRAMFAPGAPPILAAFGIALAFALPLIAASAINTVLAPVLSLAQQEELRAVRPTPMPLADAITAVQRTLRPPAYLAEMAGRAGFTQADADVALRIAERQPSIGDLADWMHRELIDPGAFVRRVQEQGVTPADAAAYRESAALIPPLADLVRMAVREAFPGQSGYGGARGSGVPGGFTEAAAHIGLSTEFARSYWAAHWELPSAGTTFEMYHRRLIDEGQLRALLREQDYAPEWVDRLIAVAYAPLTRVDVRRMYAQDVLSAADVESAYRDLGYSPQNAARLRDFTVRLQRTADEDAPSAERDLTRADLVGAYADGILTRDATGAALGDLGYSADESELLLDREDIRRQRSERAALKASIIAGATSGALSYAEAQDALGRAGLTTTEVTATLATIEVRTRAKVLGPSKGDLFAFRKAALLSDAEFRDGLAALGYPERWVDKYVALAAAQLATDTET